MTVTNLPYGINMIDLNLLLMQDCSQSYEFLVFEEIQCEC